VTDEDATLVPPTGVRIVLPTGDTVPLRVEYAGVQDGVHAWRLMLGDELASVPGPPAHLHIDVFPPRTTLIVGAPL
jgi:hypothetical protein